MSSPGNQLLPYVSRLLLARLRLVMSSKTAVKPGGGIAEEVLAAPRVILFTSGRVRYTVEDQSHVLVAPVMILLPAWLRRTWAVEGRAKVAYRYATFMADPAPAEPATPFVLVPDDVELESAAFDRIVSLFVADPKGASPRSMLTAEGVIKSILARMLAASPLLRDESTAVDGVARSTAGVNVAARWLASHYVEADALARLPNLAGLSPNHFRLAFRRLIGRSPQDHLIWLRLRAARVLLQDEAASIKEVAARVGYADTTHFARQYRKFWGRLPSDERQST